MYKEERKDENGEREYVLVLKLKIEWVGGIEKELNLNELKVGMELNLKALWNSVL